jgi:lipopolysaccharide export system permease protein
MQFVWKYIDDLVGKGLEWYIILELLFYVSATLVPLAIPLTILLSSIMTFGNLAENYELTSFKAAGTSLQRIFRPLVYFSIVLSVTVFLFSNFLLPVANLKMGSLLYDISHQKPTLELQEGIFYNGIENFTIKINKKSKDGKKLFGVMIYDHTQRNGNTKVVVANQGKMELTGDERFLVLTLYNGNSYEEVKNTGDRKEYLPFLRTTFSQQVIRMDLSDFKMTRTNEELFKDHYAMLNVNQLLAAADSDRVELVKRKRNFYTILSGFLNLDNYNVPQQNYPFNVDSVYPDAIKFTDHSPKVIFKNLRKELKQQVKSNAENFARNNMSYIESTKMEHEMVTQNTNRYMLEFHKKFTLSFACLVLFFIGAPLGAIIRKGGLGMPMVVSVLFFLIFHVISIVGEKSSKEGVLEPWLGAWLATLILLPVGVFLTYKATRDSNLFNTDSYFSFFKRIRNNVIKEKHQ